MAAGRDGRRSRDASLPSLRPAGDHRRRTSTRSPRRCASALITQGPLIAQFEEAIAELPRRPPRGRVLERDRGAARAPRSPRGSARATRSLDHAAQLRRLGQLRALPRRAAALRRHRPGDLEPRHRGGGCRGGDARRGPSSPVSFAGLPVDLEPLRGAARTASSSSRTPATRSARGAAGGRSAAPGGADMTVFSLHPVKAITTGEGGIVTDRERRAGRAPAALPHARDHEGARRPARRRTGGWYYDMQALGFNYRITDFQCALGLSQLDAARRAGSSGATRSPRAIASCSPTTTRIALPPAAPTGDCHGYHLFVVRVRAGRRGAAARVFDALRARGHRRAGPLHPDLPAPLLPRDARLPAGRAARRPRSYYAGAISLPMFPGDD